MTTPKKIFVVLGATGAQGGPVAKYLLTHSSSLYQVRAVTRDPSKPASLELASLGAEVVQGDFEDASSIAAAFKDAHIIFAITNFWDQYSYDTEVKQGKLINKLAAAVPTLEHYIFSSLADGRALDGGRFQNILPYNAKREIFEDLKAYKGLWAKSTELWVAYYWQNWLKYPIFAPTKEEGGSWVLRMPYSAETRVPSSSSEDTGVVVNAIARGGGKFFGKTVAVASELVSEGEKLRIWAQEVGVQARFEETGIKDVEKILGTQGLPPHLALATAELFGALGFEEPVIFADDVVQASDIIPKEHKLQAWQDYVKGEDWSSML